MRHVVPVIFATSLLLAACGNQDGSTSAPSTPATATATAPAAGPTWDESASPIAGTSLTANPNPVDFCTDKRQVVTISWDMAKADTSLVTLWMEDRRGNRKLWVATHDTTGSKQTGPWITEGVRVVAVDGRSRVLNSATITAAPCK